MRWGLGDTPEGLEHFVDIAVAAAAGSVGVVKPQSAFYERHGWQGIRALTRLVDECRSAGVLVLLDAKRGDVGSTNVAYGEAYFGAADGHADAGLAVDALTITPYLGLAAMRPIIDAASAAGGAVFVVTRSTNPEGRWLQQARGAGGATVEQQLIAEIAEINAASTTAAVGPVGAVFGPTHEPPADIDLLAMGGLFLAPGLGAQGATPATVAACFASCPDRVLPSASRSLLGAGPTVGALRDAIAELADEVKLALSTAKAIAGGR